MKKTLLTLSLIGLIITAASAQIQKPVHWSYGTKKLPNGNLEVHLLATIDEGWHIYAQKQTKDFIGSATKITFAKTDGLSLIGSPIEKGKKDTYSDDVVGILNYEYSGKVDFVQQVKLKPGINEIKGTVTFMSCTREMCLPEETVEFSVPIK